jgi:hypothetical protein
MIAVRRMCSGWWQKNLRRTSANRETGACSLLAKQCAVKGAGLQRVKLPPGNRFAPPGSRKTTGAYAAIHGVLG